MRRLILALTLIALPVITAAQPLAPLTATPYVSGLSSPVAFIQDPSAPHIQYVVQQGGRVRVVRRNASGTGTLQATDYLTLTGTQIASGGERGLLGMACPADYASHGHCYLNFTNSNGHTVVARYRRSLTNPLAADSTSRLDLRWSDGTRTITQPYANHNGGTLRFGPDGHLYIGMGDGGSGNDPEHRAQDPTTLLGKMLRIDVHVPPSNTDGLRVPADNPFVDNTPIDARPEIWAFGLRNPWKWTFDDPSLGGTGAMIIGDVGQGAREEIDYEPAGAGGRNYGWRNREGTVDGVTSLPLAYEPATDPIYDYVSNQSTGFGDSVAGGTVYRGLALDPAYVGRYFFADFVSGRVFSLALAVDPSTREATASDLREHTAELGGTGVLGNVAAIEADADGELYIVSFTGTIFRIAPGDSADRDNDGLNDAWERRFGLNPGSGAGADGASGDPDGDGRTNAAEFAANTHPTATVTRYLAEGATSSFFDLSLNLANATTTPARVVVRFLRSDGQVFAMHVLVPAQRRVSINPRTIAGLETAEFSTVVESNVDIAVSRDMHWDAARRFGAHAERAVTAPTHEWFLAEGATHSGLQLFYLLQNPNAFAVDADVTYLFPGGQAPLTKRYRLPATSRTTLWINQEDARLAATDVSAQIRTTDNSGIVVERALYLNRPGQTFGAGHDGAGATAAGRQWYLAEGATLAPFDLFVLVANPGLAPAQVEARFLLPNGSSTTATRTIAPQSRDTIWVDQEPGLAGTSVSTVVTSQNGVPIVVERAMWWGDASGWYEAHVSLGSTTVGAEWTLAEGAAGYGDNSQSYVLISNTGTVGDTVDVTVLYEDRAPETKAYVVGAGARFTVSIGDEFPNALHRRFGVHIEARNVSTLAVEGSVYNDAEGAFWGAGTNLLATKVR